MNLNRAIVEQKLREFLEEDCHFKDVSSEFIPEEEIIKAKIIAKSQGYISGLEMLSLLFQILEIKLNILKKNGDPFEKGEVIVEL